MRPSVVVKKLISIAALGVSLFITLEAIGFFLFMGWEFGYEDLQCKQFPETRKFAEELKNSLLHLEYSAEFKNSYEEKMPETGIMLTNLRYSNAGLSLDDEKFYTLQTWMNAEDYYYEADEYGITEIYSYSEDVFNDDWYAIALDSWKIKDASSFCQMSRDEYIELLLDHANPNTAVVDDFSEEDFKDFITSEGYSLGSVETTTEVTDASGYIDNNFSANSYIGYYDGVMYVYSPEEDMFYSSLYGWYTIPDVLYFIRDEVADCRGIDLLFCQFTSREEIFRQKVGDDYLYYVQQVKNLSYEKRNIAYYIASGKELYSNVGSLDKLVNCNVYLCIKSTASGEYTAEFYNFENVYLDDEYITGLMQNLEVLKPDDALYIGVYTTYPYSDVFATGNQMFKEYYPFTIPALVVAIVMGIVSIIMLVNILRTSGKVSIEDTTIYLTFIDKIPVELIFAVGFIGLCVLLFRSYDEMVHVIEYWYANVMSYAVSILFGYVLFITGLLSLVRRGKAKQLFDKSLVRWAFLLLKRIVISIACQKNLMARTVELFLLYWMVMLFGVACMLFANGVWVVLLGIAIIGLLNIGTLIILLWQAKGEQTIRDATRALAEGNLEYKAKSIKRLGTEQEIVDNIEHLSDGLQKAVEKSIYDERMKAELITNVSHDIKTPLTSIINYVDLIKRENIEDEKILHYIEVLDRKSQRLKQLTEDLVEVSKITTGNIELERVPIDFGELLRQSIGEFEDKFAEQELQIVDSIQEHSYMIFADGRRTFRILENLFQNIYKYAMPKTRVYIDLENKHNRIELSIKNISKAPLNIDVKELMERFIRGDESRTTEGSGLGLSIAQDLVRLQDGEFQIYLDGDLFKVMITFPEYISEEIVVKEISKKD